MEKDAEEERQLRIKLAVQNKASTQRWSIKVKRELRVQSANAGNIPLRRLASAKQADMLAMGIARGQENERLKKVEEGCKTRVVNLFKLRLKGPDPTPINTVNIESIDLSQLESDEEVRITPVKPSRLGEVERKTLSGLEVVRRKDTCWEIWDLDRPGEKRWISWDPTGGPINPRSRHLDSDQYHQEHRKMLWKHVVRVIRVVYFCKPQCRIEDVQEYIPREAWAKAFSPLELGERLLKWKPDLHHKVLTKQVREKILPRWEKSGAYPQMPFDVTGDDDDAVLNRLCFFEDKVRRDNAALDMFLSGGGMDSVVYWEQIKKKKTSEDEAVYDWAIESLVRAANLMYESSIDADMDADEKRLIDGMRSSLWENLATTDDRNGHGPPHPNTIPIEQHHEAVK